MPNTDLSPAPLDPVRAAIVAEALSWLGTPYHAHARVKGAGVDCVNLLCAVAEGAGLIPPTDPGFYAREWHLTHSPELFADELDKRATRTDWPQPGDVALYRFGRTYSHGAVFLEPGLLLHAYARVGGVVVHRWYESPLAGRPMICWDATTLHAPHD